MTVFNISMTQRLRRQTSPPRFVSLRILAADYFSFSGLWTDHAEEATADRQAKLELSFQDQDVYLVMGGAGTVTVSSGNGLAPTTIHVKGVPKLYTLFHSKSTAAGTLKMTFTPGVQAYDFTFG